MIPRIAHGDIYELPNDDEVECDDSAENLAIAIDGTWPGSKKISGIRKESRNAGPALDSPSSTTMWTSPIEPNENSQRVGYGPDMRPNRGKSSALPNPHRSTKRPKFSYPHFLPIFAHPVGTRPVGWIEDMLIPSGSLSTVGRHVVKPRIVDFISHETGRQTLKNRGHDRSQGSVLGDSTLCIDVQPLQLHKVMHPSSCQLRFRSRHGKELIMFSDTIFGDRHRLWLEWVSQQTSGEATIRKLHFAAQREFGPT
jgi:hypothetical protein